VAELRIGTSGWVYRHWRDIFYPAGLAGEGQLPFYAARFDTVEVNYSFYRLPERSVFEGWRHQVPTGFCFAVKASRYLTHMKKLKDPQEPLARLMERAEGLGPLLGPVLFQFPHTWHADVPRLHAFLEALRQYAPQRFAFEFRHQSWLGAPVYDALAEAGAALCLPDSPQLPLEVRLTAPWTYVRLHGGRWGTGYTDEELRLWAQRLQTFLAQGADAYVYFNNDPDGHAIRDASRLRELMAQEHGRAA
jgi:uncharacterized protein YecE (DUF72 family)